MIRFDDAGDGLCRMHTLPGNSAGEAQRVCLSGGRHGDQRRRGISVRVRLCVAALIVLLAGGATYGQNPDNVFSRAMDRAHPCSELASIPSWDDGYYKEPEYEQLCKSILSSSVDDVRKRLAEGLDVNRPGFRGMTPLLLAFAAEEFEVFIALLEQGADPGQPLEVYFPVPARIDARMVFRPVVPVGDCVTLLAASDDMDTRWLNAVLEYGGDINVVNERLGRSVLMNTQFRDQTCDEAVTVILRAKPQNLNYQDRDGNTAAMILFRKQRWFSVARMIESGMSADSYNNEDEQLIDLMADYWVLQEKAFADEPRLREFWNQTHTYRAWNRLVAVMSERGYNLKKAAEELKNREQMIDGVPYLRWRRIQRGHLKDNGDSSSQGAPAAN